MVEHLGNLVRLPSGPESDVLRGRIVELGDIIDLQEGLKLLVRAERPGGLDTTSPEERSY